MISDHDMMEDIALPRKLAEQRAIEAIAELVNEWGYTDKNLDEVVARAITGVEADE